MSDDKTICGTCGSYERDCVCKGVMPKLAGNQNVRGDDGRWKDESLAGQPGYNVETDEHRSPWLKEWDRLGREMESSVGKLVPMGFTDGVYIDQLAVNAVIHAQVLKRP